MRIAEEFYSTNMYIIIGIVNVYLPLCMLFFSLISVAESFIHDNDVFKRSGTIISSEIVFPTSITEIMNFSLNKNPYMHWGIHNLSIAHKKIILLFAKSIICLDLQSEYYKTMFSKISINSHLRLWRANTNINWCMQIFLDKDSPDIYSHNWVKKASSRYKCWTERRKKQTKGRKNWLLHHNMTPNVKTPLMCRI